MEMGFKRQMVDTEIKELMMEMEFSDRGEQ